MALVPYSGCIFSAAPGLGWLTEDSGPDAGLPILSPAFDPPYGSNQVAWAAQTPPAAGIARPSAIVLGTATVTSPPAAFDAYARVRANVAPFAVRILSPRTLEAFLELRVTYTIGVTSAVIDPARSWSFDTVTEGQKSSVVDLGSWESDPAAVAAGQTVTATASVLLWGLFSSGPDFGFYDTASLRVTWKEGA